jgi:hypothetical protein
MPTIARGMGAMVSVSLTLMMGYNAVPDLLRPRRLRCPSDIHSGAYAGGPISNAGNQTLNLSVLTSQGYRIGECSVDHHRPKLDCSRGRIPIDPVSTGPVRSCTQCRCRSSCDISTRKAACRRSAKLLPPGHYWKLGRR